MAGEQQVAWDKQNTKAMVLLLSSIHQDLTSMVANCGTASKAWKYLSERFDRDTGDTTINLFRALTNLRYQDGEDLLAHIDVFHEMWTRMTKRCQSSQKLVAKTMRPTFESDGVKGSFFLTTLPDTMSHVIENISTRGLTTFTEIEPIMLDISEKHSIDAVDSSAHYTSTRKPQSKGPNIGKSYNKRYSSPSNQTRDQNDECNWCKKNDMTFIGHHYSNCRKLKAHNEQRKASRNANQILPKNRKSKGNQQRANEAIIIESDDDTASIANAYTAIASTNESIAPPRMNPDEKRSREDDDVQAYAVGSIPKTQSKWIFDSGASRHMSGNADDFHELKPKRGTIHVAGGLQIPVEGIGTVYFRAKLPNGSTKETKLTNVLYSRHLRSTRLFSWTYVRSKGCAIWAKANDLYLLNPDGRKALWAKFTNGTMEIQTDEEQHTANFTSFEEFHVAMAHCHVGPNPTRLYRDAEQTKLPKRPENFHCETCAISKSLHHKLNSIRTPNTKLFDLIHLDLSGKFSTKSIGGSRYFVSFINDATRFKWVRFVKHKSQVPETIKEFFAYVSTQFNATIRRFRSDNGGEYIERELQTYFRKNGIIHEPSPPYTHESNGVAERFNRTVITTTRAMIEHQNQLYLWAEAISTAVYTMNIVPHSTLPNKITPFEALYQRKPAIQHLKPFGTTAYTHIPIEARKPGTKLMHRAETGIFVGYGKSSKIRRIYIPERNVIVESRDVTFKPYQITESNPTIELMTEQDLSVQTQTTKASSSAAGSRSNSIPSEDEPTNQSGENQQSEPGEKLNSSSRSLIASPTNGRKQTPRPPNHTPDSTTKPPVTTRSGRTVKATERSKHSANMTIHNDEEEDIIDAHAHVAQDFNDDIPITIKQAQRSMNWNHWEKAIESELQSHRENNTWAVVDHHEQIQNVIGSKWVFAIKHHSDGRIARYKARLVAQGFSQIPGVDFDQTYAPVARYDSLRLIMRLAATLRLDIHQMDFDTAYLNSHISEDLYLKCPPGFEQPNKVLKLNKAIYGLKQSGRKWYGTLRDTLTSQGFKQMPFDPCVFVGPVILAVYVDDMPIVGYIKEIQSFKSSMAKTYPCKDLGQVKYLLGFEINIDDNGISISQRAYADRVLTRFGMQECNSRKTPLDPNTFPPRSTDSENVDQSRMKTYQQIIGSINYLVSGTRPDLAFTVSMLSTFNSNPSEEHLALAKQVLRYLKATINLSIHYSFKSAPLSLSMFADASWANDPDTARSFNGYILKLADSVISWSSKRQSSVAKSTCEAEYMACSYAASHLIWATAALKEIEQHFNQKIDIPTPTLLTDNQAAIDLIRDGRITQRSKHIAVHHHFVREKFEQGELLIRHTPSDENQADICTKALPLPLLTRMIDSIGLNRSK